MATKSSSYGMCEISFTSGKIQTEKVSSNSALANINCTEEINSFTSIIKDDLMNNSTTDDDDILLTGHPKFFHFAQSLTQ